MKIQHTAIVIHPQKIVGEFPRLCSAQSRNQAVRRCGGRYRTDGSKAMASRALLGAEPNTDPELSADIDRELSVRMRHLVRKKASPLSADNGEQMADDPAVAGKVAKSAHKVSAHRGALESSSPGS